MLIDRSETGKCIIGRWQKMCARRRVVPGIFAARLLADRRRGGRMRMMMMMRMMMTMMMMWMM